MRHSSQPLTLQLARAVLLLIAACPAAADPPAAAGCFPPEAPVNAFRRAWYCKQLAASGQALLVGDPAYRFTYLPSFHPARVVTVTIENGKPMILGIVLSGAGGYEPGQPKERTRRGLTTEEMRLLLQRLENAGVWEPPDKDPGQGADGARWILEARRNGRYHLHDIWSPDTSTFPQFVKVATYMLELARIAPDPDTPY